MSTLVGVFHTQKLTKDAFQVHSVYTVVSGRLNVVKNLKRTNPIVGFRRSWDLVGLEEEIPCQHLIGQTPQVDVHLLCFCDAIRDLGHKSVFKPIWSSWLWWRISALHVKVCWGSWESMFDATEHLQPKLPNFIVSIRSSTFICELIQKLVVGNLICILTEHDSLDSLYLNALQPPWLC